jgi:hypothetical protein
MFTWICPQCGREVPPAYTECPDCSKKSAETATPPPQPAAPQPEAAAPHVPQPAAQAPAAAPVVSAPEPQFRLGPHGEPLPRRRSLPIWLLTILFAAGFVGIGMAVYWAVSSSGKSGAVALSRPSGNVENPAAKPGTPVHPLQKYIEIAGVRFQQDAKKKNAILVTFLAINHSPADVSGLAGNVTLWSNTRRSDEDAQGSFSFSTDLKGYASKELTVPLTTTKPAVELADWQYLSPDVQITAPAFSGGSLLQ